MASYGRSPVSPTHYPTKEEHIVVDKSLVATCPFDRSHMMKSSRLQYHIVKCIKHYKGSKVPCPYNHSEYFEPEDLLFHLPVCPSRNSVQVQKYNSAKNHVEAVKRNQVVTSPPITNDNSYSDESWGLD